MVALASVMAMRIATRPRKPARIVQERFQVMKRGLEQKVKAKVGEREKGVENLEPITSVRGCDLGVVSRAI